MKKGGGGGVIQGNVLTCVKSFSYRGYKILCLYFSQDNNDNETAEESECPFSRWASKCLKRKDMAPSQPMCQHHHSPSVCVIHSQFSVVSNWTVFSPTHTLFSTYMMDTSYTEHRFTSTCVESQSSCLFSLLRTLRLSGLNRQKALSHTPHTHTQLPGVKTHRVLLHLAAAEELRRTNDLLQRCRRGGKKGQDRNKFCINDISVSHKL